MKLPFVDQKKRCDNTHLIICDLCDFYYPCIKTFLCIFSTLFQNSIVSFQFVYNFKNVLMKTMQLFQLSCPYSLPKKTWIRNLNWDKRWPLSIVWRLWCLRKNSHLCIQVSAVIVVNVNWWFLDGIVFSSLSHILDKKQQQQQQQHNWLRKRSQQTKPNHSTMSPDIWFVAIFHLYTSHSFIYYHSLAHQKHTHIRTSQTIQCFFFFSFRYHNNWCDRNSPRKHFRFSMHFE